MIAPLRRRGPDGEGVFVSGRIGLGHRRLAVIDPTDRSDQPMVDPELGLALVYNGALYDYRELRAELRRHHGYRFTSDGDTEVVLKAFHAWGPACVERFHGMFAFVVVDLASGAVFAARDRSGIKPLYFATPSPGEFRFASTLPALLAGGDIDTQLDPVALHHYMTLHAVVPAPRTLLRGIRKLGPAETMTLSADGAMQFHRYWAASFVPDQKPSLQDWKARIVDALRTAVQRRLVADVPVGLLLSGGLDSTLLLALVAETSAAPIRTYSIGFESEAEAVGDEFEYSDPVAARHGTEHQKIWFDHRQTLDALDDCVDAMSEPMVSHDNVGFHLLAREVSRTAKVALSGQGADEIFGGYHWYPELVGSSDPLADYARVFFDRDHAEFVAAVEPAWETSDHTRAFVQRHFAREGAPDGVDKALRLDFEVMLVDDPLKRVDNMTMAWGLETRVPFLDHELVEIAAAIPARYKVAHGGKHVLKEAVRGIVPDPIIDRPKGYFPVPALTYLRGAFLERVVAALDSDRARRRGLFRRAYVQSLLATPQEHLTPLRGSKLWQLGLLEMWLAARGL